MITDPLPKALEAVSAARDATQRAVLYYDYLKGEAFFTTLHEAHQQITNAQRALESLQE